MSDSIARQDVAPELAAALGEMPAAEAALIEKLATHPDFACAAGAMQVKVHYRGEKVGGYNRQRGHWYVSKVFVREHGLETLVERLGFERVTHNAQHEYWMAGGPDALGAFEAMLQDSILEDV